MADVATRSSRTARGTVAVMMLTLMMGCQDVEPPEFTTIDDAAALTSTRADLKSIFDAAAGPESDSVRGGDVVDVTCGELYSSDFRRIEIRGSYVVKGQALEVVIDQVRTAWEKQGWEVQVTDEDRVSLETKTAGGIRVTGSARLQEAANDPENIGVGLNASTGCLKLP